MVTRTANLSVWPIVGLRLVLLGFFSAPVAVAGVPEFDVTGNTLIEASHSVEWRYDPDGSLDAEALFDPDAAFRAPLAQNPDINVGIGTYWYRFSLHNPGSETVDAYVEVESPKLDEVVFHRRDGDSIVSQRTGDTLPYHQRPVDHPTFVFPLSVPPGEHIDVVLEISTTALHTLPLVIAGEHAFLANERNDHLMFGLYFGGLLLVSWIGIVRVLGRNQPLELWYLLHSVAVGLYSADLLGLLYPLWPDLVGLHQHSVGLFAACALFTLSGFGRRFLGLAGGPARIVAVAGIVPLVGWVGGVLTDQLFSYVAFFVVILVMAVALIGSSVRSAWSGDRDGLIYLVAWLPLFMFGLLLAVLRLAPYLS